MRLIDADSIRYRNAKLELPNGRKTHGYFAVVTSVEIEEAPTIEAEPVRHASWKYYHKKGIAVCTDCSFERNVDDNFGRAVSCPNCGAKMDGGEKE